jgi:hypothetical protein
MSSDFINNILHDPDEYSGYPQRSISGTMWRHSIHRYANKPATWVFLFITTEREEFPVFIYTPRAGLFSNKDKISYIAAYREFYCFDEVLEYIGLKMSDCVST